MFGKSTDAVVTRSQSIIQEGVSIRGEFKADGDVRLDGSLEGSLRSKARVTVGATGRVSADIEAAEVLVMGQVNGKITGYQRIELRKGARVEGDLTTKALVVEEGVFFQGLSQMVSSVPAGPSVSGDGRSGGLPDHLKPGEQSGPARTEITSTAR